MDRPAQEDAGAARCAAHFGDVAAPLVEAHVHLEPVVTHLPRASCQETEAGGLVVPDVKPDTDR
jgi:hypothetical protein